MSSQIAQQLAILYQDDTVKIYRNTIQILKYYFPLPMAKTIDMIDVQAIYLKDNVDGQVWGTTPGHMDTWFALDNNRHLKKQYIEIVVRGSDVKVAFSPNDPLKVMSIIETNSSLLQAQKKINIQKEIKTQKQKIYSPKGHIIYPEQKVVPEKKGIGQSIKEKFNETMQGLKNIKDSAKEKYQEGKMNAYVSPDNRIDEAKQNIKQDVSNTKYKTGQKYKEAGKALEQKGNKMQYESYQK